jgi:hypothetical protein
MHITFALHRSSTHRAKEQRRRSNYKLSFGMGGRFRRPKKPAEVHVSNSVALYQVIGPNQEREFNDNLLPVVQVGPTIRMISYFVAQVQQEGSSLFTQDLNRIASDQYDQVWTRSKLN